ncbi:hypothetical protein L484_008705 [Morus notabilis]|uniref:F-box associated domain-containing protein n=1 Tax=Morus notabilis TaxID=981085 RepID=W9RB85_9ROSA|nr:hypothetical protein L484_008705 [Morus notabilis]
MPIGFGRRWRSRDPYVQIGLVQGQLRMSQIYRLKDSRFALKVWELIYNSIDDDASTSWILVHDVKVDMENTRNKLIAIAFHPENGDVIFLLYSFGTYRYEIVSNKFEKVREYPFPDNESPNTKSTKKTLAEFLRPRSFHRFEFSVLGNCVSVL